MKIYSSFAHLFFPRHTNNHKAKLLHFSSLFTLCIGLIAFQLLLRFIPDSHSSQQNILGYASQISINEVIQLTNEKRLAAGLSPVTFNQQLTDAAKEKGQHMLANDYWAHVAPDGTEPWHFFQVHNYKYRYAGENLARDFSSASAAVDAWMASPSHRDNMLSSKYKDVGVAVVEGDLGSSDTTVIVQLFGTLLSDSGQSVPLVQAKTNVSPTGKPPVAGTSINITSSPSPSPTETPLAVSENQIPPSTEQLVETTISEREPSLWSQLFLPYQITRTLSFSVLTLLLLVTVLDAIIIARRKTPRVSGRAFAHIAFLGMIIIVILIVKAGKIL